MGVCGSGEAVQGMKRAVTLLMLENCAGKVIYRGNLNIIALSCLSPALHGETSGEGRLCFLNQRDASEGNVLTGNDGINLINTNTASDDNSSGAKQ